MSANTIPENTPEATQERASPSQDSVEERYSRQILFPGIGEEGQRKLLAAHAAIVGCGAIGAAAAGLLARAGVGTLTLIDRDYVEWSNLQRQILFGEDDAREGIPKAEAARRAISRFSAATRVEARIVDLVPENIRELLAGADLILDATDNFETRYLLNDYAVAENKPWIYAGAVGSRAVTMNIVPGETACLACIFPEPPTGNLETCDTSGVLNPAASLAASLESAEAIKWLAGARDRLRRTLLCHDIWTNERSEIDAGQRRKDCEVCGQRQFHHLAGASRPRISLCGRNSVQIHEHRRSVDFTELEQKLRAHGAVRRNAMLLRFDRGGYRITVFADGRAIIQGTTDIAQARSLYSRFIGS